MPPKPRPALTTPLHLHPTTHLSDNITITGTHPITLGPGTFLHPRCKLSSTAGPITLGANVLVSERASLSATSPAGVHVGDFSVVETGARVEGRVGRACEVGVLAVVLGAVGDGGRVGAGEVVRVGEERAGEEGEGVSARVEVTVRHLEVVRGLVANARVKYG